MNKEQTRALLGQLISLQAMIREMEENGFSWDKMQSIKDNLRLMIIDIEKLHRLNAVLNQTRNAPIF